MRKQNSLTEGLTPIKYCCTHLICGDILQFRYIRLVFTVEISRIPMLPWLQRLFQGLDYHNTTIMCQEHFDFELVSTRTSSTNVCLFVCLIGGYIATCNKNLIIFVVYVNIDFINCLSMVLGCSTFGFNSFK